MDFSSLMGGGGGGGGGSGNGAMLASSATASNSFGAQGGFSESTLALIGLALVAVFALVLVTRKS